MDLFLMQDYNLSPAGVLLVAFAQNICAVWLTPVAKQTMNKAREKGYKGVVGVSFIWILGIFFMGLICVPRMPLPVVVMSIVLMQALFSSTKSFNRARLINALPHDRVAVYMAWDSLNKANQGGVAIFGAALIKVGGYHACFLATLSVMILRWCIYTGYSLHKGIRRKKEKMQDYSGDSDIDMMKQKTREEVIDSVNVDQFMHEADSELFLNSSLAGIDGVPSTVPDHPVTSNLLCVAESESEFTAGRQARGRGSEHPRGSFSTREHSESPGRGHSPERGKSTRSRLGDLSLPGRSNSKGSKSLSPTVRFLGAT